VDAYLREPIQRDVLGEAGGFDRCWFECIDLSIVTDEGSRE
jgi:hypothetical protein